MLQAADGFYTGFIKVHLRLNRPVTVPALVSEGSEGASRLVGTPSEGQDEADCWQTEKRTSFYLPCDSVKQVHIGSLTTTTDVIQGLLKKFMVLDNPRKFALYKQTHRDGQGEEKSLTGTYVCCGPHLQSADRLFSPLHRPVTETPAVRAPSRLEADCRTRYRAAQFCPEGE